MPQSAASMDETIAPSLVNQTMNEQYREGFCAFVEANFSGQFHGYSTRVELNWMELARSSQFRFSKALDWAMRSLGSLHLGRNHGDNPQISTSREVYGRALQHLGQALKKPSLARSDDTLATAILLGVYELSNATGQTSWLLHSRGISSLVRLRGPQAHTKGLARTLLVSFRGFIVYDAFMCGERCFLEDREWQDAIPQVVKQEEQRGRASRLGELIEYAFHQIASCPGLFAETKVLVRSDENDENRRQHLLTRIDDCRYFLREIQNDILMGCQENLPEKRVDFIGLIPTAAADNLTRFSLEGIGSAVSLLHQLSAGLKSDGDRRRYSMSNRPLSSSGSRGWDRFEDHYSALNVPGKCMNGFRGPHKAESEDSWLDRLSMSLGMPEEILSI
ncbi:hypothetical protein N7533_011420 [Penicillium manginii]|jgi:hypothetical protein|uniref:uncharacterized protein n=1 Tax=Penicillium manginii TaxID=203109 RepID=UPI0025496057|nr:uncharacterized protein N7533_011420 [Penicillium manginii]KAJ5742011.1 hypothetical protein N7533_011420 [Penicillium manginii]